MRVVLPILYLGGRGGTQTVETYLHAWKKYIGMTSSMEQHGVACTSTCVYMSARRYLHMRIRCQALLSYCRDTYPTPLMHCTSPSRHVDTDTHCRTCASTLSQSTPSHISSC